MNSLFKVFSISGARLSSTADLRNEELLENFNNLILNSVQFHNNPDLYYLNSSMTLSRSSLNKKNEQKRPQQHQKVQKPAAAAAAAAAAVSNVNSDGAAAVLGSRASVAAAARIPPAAQRAHLVQVLNQLPWPPYETEATRKHFVCCVCLLYMIDKQFLDYNSFVRAVDKLRLALTSSVVSLKDTLSVFDSLNDECDRIAMAASESKSKLIKCLFLAKSFPEFLTLQQKLTESYENGFDLYNFLKEKLLNLYKLVTKQLKDAYDYVVISKSKNNSDSKTNSSSNLLEPQPNSAEVLKSPTKKLNSTAKPSSKSEPLVGGFSEEFLKEKLRSWCSKSIETIYDNYKSESFQENHLMNGTVFLHTVSESYSIEAVDTFITLMLLKDEIADQLKSDQELYDSLEDLKRLAVANLNQKSISIISEKEAKVNSTLEMAKNRLLRIQQRISSSINESGLKTVVADVVQMVSSQRIKQYHHIQEELEATKTALERCVAEFTKEESIRKQTALNKRKEALSLETAKNQSMLLCRKLRARSFRFLKEDETGDKLKKMAELMEPIKFF